MADSFVKSVALLGNDPADQQWSILEYGTQLEQALRQRLPESGIRLFAPDTRWIPKALRGNRPGRAGAMYFSRYLAYPALLKNIHADLYHILDHGNAALMRRLDAKRTVVFCHDLIPLMFQNRKNSLFPKLSAAAFRQAMDGMRLAAAILVNSNQTRQDLLKHLDYPVSKIFVVPLGIDSQLKPIQELSQKVAVRTELGLPQEFMVLHTGQTAFYKNFEGLLRSFASLIEKGRPFWLVHAGAWMTLDQRRMSKMLRVSHRVIEMGPQSRATLRRLYSVSDCFAYPSWYEGMGLPPLEAMASGVPVVVSNRGALPETVADAALCVDVEDPLNLARALDRLWSSPDLRQQMIARGLSRAAEFQWERAAEKTIAVYRQILGAPAR